MNQQISRYTNKSINVCMCIYIYIYKHRVVGVDAEDEMLWHQRTANLRTKILDFKGFDSGIV